MSYQISVNRPNGTCKVHCENCKSIKQVIGDKPSDNQEYSSILDSCEDVREWLRENRILNYSNCKKCNPTC